MKNLTIKTAINLGFDYENSDFETKEELEQEIMNFLAEHLNKLPKVKVTEEVVVTGAGYRQNVNYMDYTCSGEIIQWSRELNSKPRHKIWHSSFFDILENGQPVEMMLFCWSK